MAVRHAAPVYDLGYHDVPWADARPDLNRWLPSWVRWRVRCTARRSDGQPCRAWSIHGGYVCVSHGGAAGQVILAAQRRLAIEAWERAYFRLVRSVLAWQEARRAA
jgi:hypothetical protein